jgi:uncharacterized protein YecE (DUF72 family)
VSTVTSRSAPAERVHIGISGWRYANWRGVFYPAGLPQKQELAFASRQFRTIELNGSFYSLQRPEAYRRWYAETPDDFVFAVKGGRFITHLKKLSDVATPLANFFASGVLCLEEKLGPILWQFPESFGFIEQRWQTFFELLPRDTLAAAELARKHDSRLNGRSTTTTKQRRRIRHAVEIRNRELCTRAFVELLARHGIALVVADTAGRFPYAEDVTADFVYVRLHGDTELYKSGYSPRAIRHYARRIEAFARGSEPEDAIKISRRRAPRRRQRDVFVYFDNDAKVHAPFDALSLARALGQKLEPRIAATVQFERKALDAL